MIPKKVSFILLFSVSTIFSNTVDAARGSTVKNRMSNHELTCRTLRVGIIHADGGCNHAGGKSIQEKCEMCSIGKDKIREAINKGCDLSTVEDNVEDINQSYSAFCRNLGSGSTNTPEVQPDGSFRRPRGR